MQKLLSILMLIICSLPLTGGGADALASVVVVTSPERVELSVDRSTCDVWLCERRCNSDLGLPRVPGQITTPQGVVTPPRGGNIAMEREALQSAAQRHEANAIPTSTQSNYLTLFAGSRAVDHYIYRLRRLII